jgi:hypothetical protein
MASRAKKRMAHGGKSQEEMKKVGRNRAKLANQFGSDKPKHGGHMAKGGAVMRGTGAATRGKNTEGLV